MTYLKDLLDEKPIKVIEYRCNSPFEDEEDMLFGYCSWNGKELISEDGDNYYLNDVIEDYAWDDDELIVWIKVEWSGDK